MHLLIYFFQNREKDLCVYNILEHFLFVIIYFSIIDNFKYIYIHKDADLFICLFSFTYL